LHDSQTGQLDYEYNTLDQLIQKRHHTEPSQHEAYRWDSFGNPVGEGVVVSQDRLARYPERSLDESQAHYQYDASGNQLGVKGHKQQQQREFNGFNQLISLHNGQNLTRYEYDALGRRSAKITAAGRIDYLWDGNQLIGEHCQDRFTWYLYEPAGNSSQSYRLFALIVQGEVYYYQLDQLGTPFALLDQHNNLVWQASYSALGQATVSVNVIANPLRFQGQYYDEESGLHYNHFRYYDPQTGRFISQDPIGLLGGLNHYQYAPNHINWIDPWGLSCKEGAALAGVAALARPLPVPITPATPVASTVGRIAVGTAANDSIYAVGESLLSRALPIAGVALTGLAALVYSPGLRGGLEEITAPDGTQYSKYSDEIIYHAVGVDGETWGTANPQDDIQYRMWKANGGEGSFEDWLSEGKPNDIGIVSAPKSKSIIAITAGSASDTPYGRGSWASELENPQANTIYEVTSIHDGQPATYTYETDDQGRTVRVTGKLRKSSIDDQKIRDKKHRSSRQSEYGGDDPEYDGGHLIGTLFQGPAEKINLVPQLKEQNRHGEWRQMEKEWAKNLDRNREVEVEILVEYEGDSTTPKRLIANSTINGVRQSPKKFKN